MADTHEQDPALGKILKKVGGRRIEHTRWLLAYTNGFTSAKDISSTLYSAGYYSSPHSAEVSVKNLFDDLNEVSELEYGGPLFTKKGRVSPYSVNADLAEQYMQLRYAMLPMDMGAADPTLFMDDEQKEKLKLQSERFEYFAAHAAEVSDSLASIEKNKDLLVIVRDETVFLPRKDLSHIFRICTQEGKSYPGTLNKEQLAELRIDHPKATALNELCYTLVGRPLVEITKRAIGEKHRNEYEIDFAVLGRIGEIGIEVARLPELTFSTGDVDQLEKATELANRFMSGSLRELGFVNNLDIRDSLIIRHMLEGFEHENRAIMARKNQLLFVLNRRLAYWGAIRKKDVAIHRFAREIVAEGRPVGGACDGINPELFYPERGASTREAKDVCKGCTKREDCLKFALDNNEKFGIWGGLSERERRRLRRKRAQAAKAAKLAVPSVAEVNQEDEMAHELVAVAGD